MLDSPPAHSTSILHDDGHDLASVEIEAETQNCRTPGCPREAKWTRGKFAFMCEQCADEKRQRDAANPATVVRDAASLSEAVKALVTPAAKLERAIAKRNLGRQEARDAVEDFNAALKLLRETAQALIA